MVSKLRFRSPVTCMLAAVVAAVGFWVSPAQAADEMIYRVEPGDTLMRLGKALLARPDDWVKVQRLNKVADPRRIPVGTELRIPLALLQPFPRSAQVSAVAGEALVDGRAAEVGTRVGAGSALETGAGGHIAIELPDGSQLVLPARSKARIERLHGYGGTDAQTVDLSLEEGRVESQVAPQRGPAARYRVDTPTAVIGVRGTDFRVGWDSEHATSRAEVTAGSVVASAAATGSTRTLESGYGLVTRAGAVRAEAVALLPAPDLSALPTLFERPLIRVPLPELDGARQWRVQVTRADAPVPVLFDQRVDEDAARIPDLSDGEYRLLVRGIDGSTLEGFDAEHRFRLKARPEPPFTSLPQDGSKTSAGKVALTWTHAPEATHYIVEVAHVTAAAAPDAADVFAAPARREVTNSSAMTLELEPGEHAWRVASVRADGDQGPWSDPVSFTVRPLQALPEPPEIGKDAMTFRWVSEPEQRFEYQISRDAAFSGIVSEGELAVPELVVQRPAPGTYYLRIRAIDADGFVNAWTGAQRVEVPADPPWWMMLAPLLLL